MLDTILTIAFWIGALIIFAWVALGIYRTYRPRPKAQRQAPIQGGQHSRNYQPVPRDMHSVYRDLHRYKRKPNPKTED